MRRLTPALFRSATLLAWGILLAGGTAARGDIFVLKNDGQVQGEVLNTGESPRQNFVVRLASGGQITLDKSQVKQIIPQSPAELEYEKIRSTYPVTAADQWQLAEWCREHSLLRQRQTHLEKVIELDPDHKAARAALGYSQVEGRWVRQDDLMEQRGFVRYKGQWKLPQEVDLLERKGKEDLAVRNWYGKLKRWRAGVDLRPDHAEQSHDDLLAVKDPMAVPALTQMLNNDAAKQVKTWCIEALVQIGTSGAISAVVASSMDDPNEDVRISALDRLAAEKHPEVIPTYVQALRSKDNARVNRAAYCLGRLKDKSAIVPLIDALVTTHKFLESDGPPGQTTTTFSNGPSGNRGGGIAINGSPKLIKENLPNQQVLDALVALTDNAANFGYDARAWKTWYASQRKPVNIDARRD